MTIQAQIFELIKQIRAELGTAMLLITHDLGVVSEMCDRVAVMYAGQIMEVAPLEALFARPQHPYTQLLMNSVLRLDRPVDLEAMQEISSVTISYDTPGCRFADRCAHVRPVCWQERPPPLQVAQGHQVVCHMVLEAAG